MANELEISAQSGSTVYAIIRRESDAYVWNFTAFEAWSNGSLASYKIALTDRGGDLFQSDWPSSILAGAYRATYYTQAAGSPSVGDAILSSNRISWNGTAASSGSTVDLDPYALTTLESAKRNIRIDASDADDDTILTELINQVSSEIERVCKGRKFKARNYRERINGIRQGVAITKQFPVITLTRLSYGYANAFSVSFTGGIRANAAIFNDGSSDISGGCRLSSVSSLGVPSTSDLLFSDYPSVGLLAAAISNLTGWTAAVISNQPSADLNPASLGNSLDRTVYATYPDQQTDEYAIDYPAGMIQLQWQLLPFYQNMAEGRSPVRFPEAFQGLLVEYRAGFETIPADVTRIANQLVQDAFYEGMRDRRLTLGSMGPYKWQASAQVADSITDQLSHYIDASRTYCS